MGTLSQAYLRARARLQRQKELPDAPPPPIVEDVLDSWRPDKRPKKKVHVEEHGLRIEPQVPGKALEEPPLPVSARRPSIHRGYARNKLFSSMLSQYEADAVYAYCGIHGITVSALVREATLRYVGYKPPRETLADSQAGRSGKPGRPKKKKT